MDKKKIVYVYTDEDEVEGFFDIDGNYLKSWSMNDAIWRHEYMDPLLDKLGIEVVCKQDKKLIDKLKKMWDL